MPVRDQTDSKHTEKMKYQPRERLVFAVHSRHRLERRVAIVFPVRDGRTLKPAIEFKIK
jgi:hypothetical protein